MRRLEVSQRYDAILHDMKQVKTEEFEEASKKRFKVERRFATMVRYLRLGRAKIHITLANMACNIVRMVNLLYQPSIAMLKN